MGTPKRTRTLTSFQLSKAPHHTLAVLELKANHTETQGLSKAQGPQPEPCRLGDLGFRVSGLGIYGFFAGSKVRPQGFGSLMAV